MCFPLETLYSDLIFFRAYRRVSCTWRLCACVHVRPFNGTLILCAGRCIACVIGPAAGCVYGLFISRASQFLVSPSTAVVAMLLWHRCCGTAVVAPLLWHRCCGQAMPMTKSNTTPLDIHVLTVCAFAGKSCYLLVQSLANPATIVYRSATGFPTQSPRKSASSIC